jgi:hypothetical protein
MADTLTTGMYQMHVSIDDAGLYTITGDAVVIGDGHYLVVDQCLAMIAITLSGGTFDPTVPIFWPAGAPANVVVQVINSTYINLIDTNTMGTGQVDMAFTLNVVPADGSRVIPIDPTIINKEIPGAGSGYTGGGTATVRPVALPRHRVA